MTTEPPKRRWLQFRLRTLLITVLVLSLPLSWFAVTLQRARRQREAMEAIEKAGGLVEYYDWEPIAPFRKRNIRFEPLRFLLGDDFFHYRLQVVFFRSTFWQESSSTTQELEICEDDLRTLADLNDLRSLIIESGQVTDEGLKHLYGLKDLESLCLLDTRVTPEGVKKLQEALPNCNIEY